MKRILLFGILLLLTLCSYGQQNRNKLFSRKENFVDMRERLTLYAAILNKHAAPAFWQKVMEARECDELLLLPDGNILFGTIDLKPAGKSLLAGHNILALFPNYGTLYKVDALAGNILWKYERKGLMGTATYSFLDVSDKALIMQENDGDKASFVQLDIMSGKELWRQTIEPESQCMKIADNILVFRLSDKGLNYKNYSLSEKKQVYTNFLENISKEYQLRAFGETKVILLDNTVCYLMDAASGKTIKKMDSSSPYTNIYNASASLLLVSKDGSCRMINEEGLELWNNPAGYPPLFCNEWGGNIYWTTYDGKVTLLSAVSKNNGESYWSCELDNPIMSDFCIHDGILVLTTNSSLYFIDLETGEPVKQTHVPVGEKRSLDLIQRRNNHWIVTYETGIECYNDSFEKQWSYEIGNFVKTTAAYLAETNSGEYVSFKNPMSGMADFQMSMISLQQSISQGYANTLKYGYANPTSSQMIDSRTSMAQFQKGVQVEKQAATFALASSVATIGASVFFNIMGNKVQAETVKAANLRSLYAYRLASREAKFTNQDDYYIKRFETGRSRNLLIVNLNDGQWGEIVLGPREGADAEENALLNTCLYVYHPDEDMIVCNGIGLNPSKWEAIELHKTTTVKSSLLSFKISDLKFRDYNEYGENSLTIKK